MDDLVEHIFSPEGLLQRSISNYESREGQRQMAQAIVKAYQDRGILLVEAATGVGKSWAYLIPAILFAVKHREMTVISTHTIALQEQLLRKDIPLLLKLLNVDLQVTLAKGMGNYLCLKKLEELSLERDLLSEIEQKEIDRLEEFAKTAIEGSTTEMKVPLEEAVWEKVSAERFSCLYTECPHFKRCFFFRARKLAQDSQVLIVNHHLLALDLMARLRPDFSEEKSLLPKFSKVVVDEAHHLESIALDVFAHKVDRLELVRLLGRLYSDHQPTKSRLGMIKSLLSSSLHRIPPQLLTYLEVEIPVQKRLVTTLVEELFSALEQFCQEELVVESSTDERRWRLRQEKTESSLFWKEKVEECFTIFHQEWNRLRMLMEDVRNKVAEALVSESEKELFSSHFTLLESTLEAIAWKLEHLELGVFPKETQQRVRWVHKPLQSVMENVTLVDATLDVSKHLKQLLFAAKETVVLCSATLTTQGEFSFIKKQIGLDEIDIAHRVQEKTYVSPFDYQKNALFLVPVDFPYPHEPSFLTESINFLKELIRASQGGCFLLFTSYEMLQACYKGIICSMDKPKVTYLKQGDMARGLLLEEFKKTEDAVLFATSSFWEGVDVAGKALRCVVLVKIPFKVPTDPLFQAMSEKVAQEGGDPFTDYSLPLAFLQFKQGFGRLIRTGKDRGCVICLDKRVMTKSYGALMRKGLPPCPTFFLPRQELLQKMHHFYEK